ncbi:hypothetical protein T492DRAFT_1088114 [Pavlovales sp. CCMP2436]|nr:hypothetical protein T492DRAFT_1088114 [Pavlovales sp. CCMP2436]|mmetsp:Transcript_36831/g.91700  ORF Transcript_36831/g.91700 Transcript_36831/m.91700 type:complete len:130 (-) Transcript_36831:267-656(-)
MGSSFSRSADGEDSKVKILATKGMKRLSDAGETMGKAVRTQALKAEIMLKENSIKGLKQELGLAVYDALETADSDVYMSQFQATKSKVDALVAEIDLKKAEIAALRPETLADIDEAEIEVKMADGSPSN